MPLNEKGQEIMANMKKQYGEEKGERVFYASKNAGTIKGVDSTTVTTSRSISPELGRTTVTHTNDATNTVDGWFRDQKSHPAGLTVSDQEKGGPLVTGAYPTPERHKDLLGEVSQPESTPRGPQPEAKPPERTKSAGDKKAKDQSSTFSNVQSGAPMNNLGHNIPTPNISARPSAGTSSASTGDSLRGMNQANRAFWARRR